MKRLLHDLPLFGAIVALWGVGIWVIVDHAWNLR